MPGWQSCVFLHQLVCFFAFFYFVSQPVTKHPLFCTQKQTTKHQQTLKLYNYGSKLHYPMQTLQHRISAHRGKRFWRNTLVRRVRMSRRDRRCHTLSSLYAPHQQHRGGVQRTDCRQPYLGLIAGLRPKKISKTTLFIKKITNFEEKFAFSKQSKGRARVSSQENREVITPQNYGIFDFSFLDNDAQRHQHNVRRVRQLE